MWWARFLSSHAEDVDLAVAAAKKAFATWRLVPAPKRARSWSAPVLLLQERKEAVCPRHDPRDGQGAGRDPRRRAGGDRRSVLRGRRGTAAVWADHPERTAEQVRHERAHAGGRGGADHAVELPHGDSELEAVSGAGCGQHLRDQAGHGYAALHLSTSSRR